MTTIPEMCMEPVAIRQYRKTGCADWYDGYADHEDGGGPYEERTLYATPPQRPAEPVQELVGAAGLFTLAHLWAQQAYFKGLGKPCDIDGARGAFEQALRAYTAPQQPAAEPVQEPVAYIHRQGNHREVSERPLVDDEKARGWTEEPLYTSPPQRKPLTEEEIEACRQQGYAPGGLSAPFDFGKAARAVERALEEKNRGR